MIDAKVYNKKSNCKRAALVAHPDGRFEILPTEGGFYFRPMQEGTTEPVAPEGTESDDVAAANETAVEAAAQAEDPDADLDDPTKPWNQTDPGLKKILDQVADENEKARIKAEAKAEIAASPTVPVSEGRGTKTKKGKAKEPKPAKAKGQPAAEPKAGSKGEVVATLLSRPEGATVAQIVAETGWEPHTTRGYISRMKSSGQTIETTKTKGEPTVYRLVTK